MQNPVQEVEGVVKGLVESKNATEQLITLKTYYTANAAFDHPLARVTSGRESRDHGILQIYQWLRVMSNSTIIVTSKGFDEKTSTLFLEAVQTLRPRLTPFIEIPARIFVVLKLVKNQQDGLYYVKSQEDVYQVQVLPGKILPIIGPAALNTFKSFVAFNCYILALVFAIILGLWRPTNIHPRK